MAMNDKTLGVNFVEAEHSKESLPLLLWLNGAAVEGIWDNGAACGGQYLVRCISAVVPRTCIPSQTVQVRIVDRAHFGNGATIVLSTTAFGSIANISATLINVEYQHVHFTMKPALFPINRKGNMGDSGETSRGEPRETSNIIMPIHHHNTNVNRVRNLLFNEIVFHGTPSILTAEPVVAPGVHVVVVAENDGHIIYRNVTHEHIEDEDNLNSILLWMWCDRHRMSHELIFPFAAYLQCCQVQLPLWPGNISIEYLYGGIYHLAPPQDWTMLRGIFIIEGNDWSERFIWDNVEVDQIVNNGDIQGRRDQGGSEEGSEQRGGDEQG